MEIDPQILFERALPTLAAYAVRLAGAVAVLFMASIAAGWASRATARGCGHAQLDLTLSRFTARLVRWLIILMAALACLGLFGVNITTFAALIGAAGLAVGLAFQGTLSNFAAGIMLLVFRPFVVGDFVRVAGCSGTVDELGLFMTSMNTTDFRRLIIPNSEIFGTIIENVGANPWRRVDVDVGVAYTADIDATRKVLETAAASVTLRLEGRDVQVVLGELGDSAIQWQARVWVDTANYLDARQELTRAIKVELDRVGIGIPFPQMDVHVDSQ